MDTALITYTNGTLHECTLNDTASLAVNFTSAGQTLQITNHAGETSTVDLSTVESIAFSQSPVAQPAPEVADTTDSPSDVQSTDTSSEPVVDEPVTTDSEAPAVETTTEEVPAPTVVDVTNGEEIQIEETDAPAEAPAEAPVVPEVAAE